MGDVLELNVDYPIHTRTLRNGLRVCVSPDRAVPVVGVNLWYDVGSRDEIPGQTGWAHLFEHLMFQGSAQVASGEHLAAIQAIGGTVNATTSFDRTNYYETIPVGGLDLALWMEADRLATLADHLSDESVATQREVVKEERRQRYDNVPYGDAIEQLIHLCFPSDHPYGHSTIGSMVDVDSATKESAQRFFAEHYRVNNAVLTLCGDITPEDGFQKAEQYFGQLESRSHPQRVVPGPLPPLAGVPRLETYQDVPADAVYFVWRLPTLSDPCFDAVQLGMAILSYGQTSRFYRNLIQGQLAQNVGCSPLGLIGGNSLGFASAHCLPDVTLAELEQAVSDEFEKLATTGPSVEELERIKTQFLREWLSSLAHLGTRADYISGDWVLFNDPSKLNRRVAEINRVTSSEIRSAIANYLNPDARGVLTIGKDA